MANKNIVKGEIGNALHSVAPDHIVTTSDEVFDETLQMYQNEVNFLKGVFDISAYNLTDGQPTKYADLAAALGTNGANVPEQYRVPGMRIQYVQSSDNKYVQYRCIADEFTTDIIEWQSENLDNTPIAMSDNPVKSGGVYNDTHDVGDIVDIYSIEEKNCSLSSDSTTWFGVNSKGKHKVIPVSADDVFYIKVADYVGYYGWLTSSYTGNYSNGDTVPYVNGEERHRLEIDNNYTLIKAPQGAAYLCICTQSGNGVYPSWDIREVKSIKEILSKTNNIISKENYLWEKGTFNGAGGDANSDTVIRTVGWYSATKGTYVISGKQNIRTTVLIKDNTSGTIVEHVLSGDSLYVFDVESDSTLRIKVYDYNSSTYTNPYGYIDYLDFSVIFDRNYLLRNIILGIKGYNRTLAISELLEKHNLRIAERELLPNKLIYNNSTKNISTIDMDSITEELGVIPSTISANHTCVLYKNNDYFKHKKIPVIAGQIYRIKANDDYDCYFAQVKNYSSDTITLSDYDYIRHSFPKGENEIVYIHSDTTYLFINTLSNNNNIAPSLVELVNIDTNLYDDKFQRINTTLYDDVLVDVSSLKTADASAIIIALNTNSNTATITGTDLTGSIRAGFDCSNLTNGKLYRLRFKVTNTNVKDVDIRALESLSGSGDVIATVPQGGTLVYDAPYLFDNTHPIIGVYKGAMTSGVILSFDYFEVCQASEEHDKSIVKFRYGHWNVGHFSYYDGRTGSDNTSIDGEHSEEMALRFKKVFNSIDADVFGIAEYNPEFDTVGNLAKDVVFQNYKKQYIGVKYSYNCNSIFLSERFSVVDSQEIAFSDRIQQRYYKSVGVVCNGKTIYFVETHLDWQGHEGDTDGINIRQTQMQQLITAFADKDYVVISADWNVQSIAEYSPFVEAGYTLLNGGYIGDFITARSANPELGKGRIDNIIVKGFRMSNIKVYDDTWSYAGVEGGLSDHAAISCDLEMTE